MSDFTRISSLPLERLILGGNLKQAHAVNNSLHPRIKEVVVAIEPIDFKLPPEEIAQMTKQIADNYEPPPYQTKPFSLKNKTLMVAFACSERDKMTLIKKLEKFYFNEPIRQ